MRIRMLTLLCLTGAVLATVPAGCAPGPTPTSDAQTSTAESPPATATPLQPNPRGYVRIEMQATSVGCSISAELLTCQRFSGAWHDKTGQVRHTVSVSAGGEFHWVDADLGELQGRISLGCQTYSAQGWTIFAEPGVTRFVNDQCGHGMMVDAERVTPF